MSVLNHIGVLGMKWGHRKGRQEESGVALVRGDTAHHVTINPNLRPQDGGLYVSFTKKDVEQYRTEYKTFLEVTRDSDKIFEYKMSVVKDLVTPSKKEKIDTFISLYRKDKTEKLIEEMAENKIQSSIFLAIARKTGHDPKSKVTAKYRELLKSEEPRVKQKMFNDFAKFLVWSPESRKKYFKSLSKKGYSAMYDDFDMEGGYSEAPLIVFNPAKSLKITSKTKL